MLLSRPSSPRRPLHLLLQRPRAALFGLPATQKVLAEAAALEGGSPAAVFNWENTVDAEMVYMDVADEPALRRQPNGVPKGIGLGARNLFDDLQKQTVKVIASIVMFERRLTLKGMLQWKRQMCYIRKPWREEKVFHLL
ncbi:uncharacterized protein LOC104581755 isoform X2 [Brachypodium distachyon]|uniref:uncharacterized protein LOC104581755 isoform X2 n=1 Tax=Brachypodium distachyon TaxID=15368 RepID=UPI00071D531E|nr:uncharacterized protein LOC104581755 isoform X2 [Brachypodium distachyon]|eukprot:XP_014758144.1 uncharacterized protein LOC104581755 isoform X2 [Brachypodium distachyon]